MSDLLTSGFALVGVLVGGGLTYGSQRRLEVAKAKREAEKDKKQAVATARLLRDDTYRAQTAIVQQRLINDGWWVKGPMRTSPDTQDLKALAVRSRGRSGRPSPAS